MVNRKLKKKIQNSLQHFPVVGLIGSRQAGKTTLAKEILKNNQNSIYLDIEA
jgi:predicted AAA+ superfamily ATPase